MLDGLHCKRKIVKIFTLVFDVGNRSDVSHLDFDFLPFRQRVRQCQFLLIARIFFQNFLINPDEIRRRSRHPKSARRPANLRTNLKLFLLRAASGFYRRCRNPLRKNRKRDNLPDRSFRIPKPRARIYINQTARIALHRIKRIGTRAVFKILARTDFFRVIRVANTASDRNHFKRSVFRIFHNAKV